MPRPYSGLDSYQSSHSYQEPPGSCASIGLAEDVDLKLRQGIRVVICLDTGNYGVELVEESVLHSSVLESTRSKICY